MGVGTPHSSQSASPVASWSAAERQSHSGTLNMQLQCEHRYVVPIRQPWDTIQTAGCERATPIEHHPCNRRDTGRWCTSRYWYSIQSFTAVAPPVDHYACQSSEFDPHGSHEPGAVGAKPQCPTALHCYAIERAADAMDHETPQLIAPSNFTQRRSNQLNLSSSWVDRVPILVCAPLDHRVVEHVQRVFVRA